MECSVVVDPMPIADAFEIDAPPVKPFMYSLIDGAFVIALAADELPVITVAPAAAPAAAADATSPAPMFVDPPASEDAIESDLYARYAMTGYAQSIAKIICTAPGQAIGFTQLMSASCFPATLTTSANAE